MFLSKGLYSKPDGRKMSLKSVNEHACLSGATHCIHVPVRNTKPFTPKVHKHMCTHRHTHTRFWVLSPENQLVFRYKRGTGRAGWDGGWRMQAGRQWIAGGGLV